MLYTIYVDRGQNEGTLRFDGGGVHVSTTCWWNFAKRIPEGTYSGCSATTMATKKNSIGKPREAVTFPCVPGFSGIFIHKGTSDPIWSDGCIVIREKELLKIYDHITPKNGRNVTVVVRDTVVVKNIA
jgi:hypothetical protein